MRRLTRAEMLTLDIANRMGGTIRVFPDQRIMVTRLEALGLVRGNGNVFFPEATITDAGRKVLAGGSDAGR